MRRHNEQLASHERDSYNGSVLTSAWGGSATSDALNAATVSAPPLPWEHVELEAQNAVNLEQGVEQADTDGMAISFVDEQDQGFFGKLLVTCLKIRSYALPLHRIQSPL